MNNNNRNNNNNNRRRGRGSNNRQQGGQQLNRIDSRARGNAPQMLEKYRKLAHDAHLNGDRVTEEYNLQFADHYFRVIADQRVRQDESRQPRTGDRASEFGDEFAEDDYYAESASPYAPGSSAYGGAPNSNQGSSQGGSNNASNGNGNGNGGNANAAQGEGRTDNRPERGPRPERAERQDRNDRNDRNERPARADRNERVDRQPAPEVSTGEGPVAQGGERTVYEPVANPFVREGGPARGDRKPRRAKREDAGTGTARGPSDDGDEPAPAFDPSSLPPPISARRDEARKADAPQAEAAKPDGSGDDVAVEAPLKPKRRTRRAAPPADDAAGALESVN